MQNLPNKYEALSPAGLPQPLPTPTMTWSDLSMDFIMGLPKLQGYDTIMVAVDRLSTYAQFIPLTHPFTAKEVAKVFIKEVVRLHGFPASITSDRDRVFLSSFWSELFKLFGTQLKYSSTYHPQTDGQTDVVNRCLETYLRCFTSRKPKQWHKWLNWAEFCSIQLIMHLPRPLHLRFCMGEIPRCWLEEILAQLPIQK